jgi:predicted alpha/beta-hydrolase family hydrolase
MTRKKLRIDVHGGGSVSAIRDEPAKRSGWTFVYAPGAGSNLGDPFGALAAQSLATRGVTVIRFQFPYMEAGRKSPDRPVLLEATWRAVIDSAREPKGKLAVGGRSMGGRIASQVVATGTPADALALFAYPLHPPGKPEAMRTLHLADIRVPTLFVSGTNDAFGSPAELRSAAKKVKGAQVYFLDGADHGFAVRKSSGRTKDDVFAEAADTFGEWLLNVK